MNKAACDLMDRELSFEEFEQLAANVPKRAGSSVFRLVEIDIPDDSDGNKSMYPEFQISRCCKGVFSSLSNAEAGIHSCVSKNESDIYCFKIYELPLDRLSDIGGMDSPDCIREYLYGANGEMLEHTVCSSLMADLGTEYGSYLGKPKSQLRFKKGDIVEVMEDDTVRIAIISHDPIDTEWCYDLYRRVRKDTKHRRYMLDYSDDQVAVVDGPEYGNHSHIRLCDIMTPRFPVPEELRRLYEGWLNCVLK